MGLARSRKSDAQVGTESSTCPHCGASTCSGDPADATTVDALLVRQEFVNCQLKSPASAGLARERASETRITHLGQGKFVVPSDLDAANSFGAKIRN